MPHLEISGLDVRYGAATVLQSIDLNVERGELVGLVPPVAGRVALDGTELDYTSKTSLRAFRDHTAIVFQQYNLFQNMTVLDNITVTPVKVRGCPRAEAEADARALLARVGLADKADAFPDQLSGGQQQRVAIARALALKPALILLDEVTAALDPELVRDVLDVIQDLARDGITLLLVSHEMGFIREAAHRVVMMDAGRVVEVGPPAQILDAPQQDRTRAFMSKIIRH